jgi:hypothetical protein
VNARIDDHSAPGERHPCPRGIVDVRGQLRVPELGIHLGIVALILAVVAPDSGWFHVEK